MKDQDHLAAEWHRLAKRVAWKARLGWWMDASAPWLAGVAVIGFAAILWVRSEGSDVAAADVVPWMTGGLLVALALGWLQARRRFPTEAESLVRLESLHGLHNALSAARSGIRPWPPIPPAAVDGWRWQWQRVLAPFALSAACLVTALWIPLASEASPVVPVTEPQAWSQMDEWLDQLEEEEVLDPESQDEQREKLAELRRQPKDQWFSHESLNAGDTLREQLGRELGEMGRNMQRAEMGLNALQNHDDQLSAQAKERIMKEFDEAVAGLETAALKLDPELLKKLGQIDPKNLKSMSKTDLQKLREALKNKSGACKECQGGMGFLGDGEGEDDELAKAFKEWCEGQCENPGSGGVNRGPGTAPLTLSDEENDFGTNKLEGVSNTDFSRAEIGDTIELRNGEHEVDKEADGSVSAGSVSALGDGGEQVWKETLTPEEKAVLKRVFR